jgi:hypothetical protein
VATATLVAAGAADLHKASTHHHKSAAQVAPATAQTTPVALGTSVPQPRSAPVVRHASSISTKTRKHHHAAIKHTTGTTSPTSSNRLPATQAGTGTFPDTPPPASTTDHPAGKVNPPTDPAKQPIGAPEPVQVQGFDPSGDSSDSSTTTSP